MGIGQRFRYTFRTALPRVAYDFGVKTNILRMLASRGCRLTVVPAQTSAEESWHSILTAYSYPTAPATPSLAATPSKPYKTDGKRQTDFGICLGHQLISLAIGAKTLKMRFSHHGANHPVQDLDSGKVVITVYGQTTQSIQPDQRKWKKNKPNRVAIGNRLAT